MFLAIYLLLPLLVTKPRPDILLSAADNILYITELTVGFETNLNNNALRKGLKYRPLLTDLANDYKQVKFVNLCIRCLGVFGTLSDSFLKLFIEEALKIANLILLFLSYPL